ncbi:MAG: transporter [Burkholderiaceae bacterium]|nr:MAG: transporter [Burkholderiaceae bacterium]
MNRLTFILLLWLAPCLAYAAHPLQTDDTGTQHTGNWQLELNTDRTHSEDRIAETSSRTREVNATLTYGAAATLDVYTNLPWNRQDDDDGAGGRSLAAGHGDQAVGLKWRAWRQDEISLGAKAELTLPTGDDTRGLGAGRANLGLTGLLQYTREHWMLLANVTLNSNRSANPADDHRAVIGGLSAAALYALTGQWRVLMDAGSMQGGTGSAAAARYFLLGVIYSPQGTLDFDLGLRRDVQGDVRATKFGGGFTLRF